MDHFILQNSTSDKLAVYLKQQLNQAGENAVSEQLFKAISTECVSPRVFRLWLPMCCKHDTLLRALQQDFSKSVRQAAIHRLGKLLRGSRFEVTWNAVGGSEGIARLLCQYSIHDVKLMCKTIARTSTSQVSRDARQTRVTELLETLESQSLTGVAFANTDPRPLLVIYQMMVPAATSQFADIWNERMRRHAVTLDKLYPAHPIENTEKVISDIVASSNLKTSSGQWSFFASAPPTTSTVDGMSPSMQVMETVLRSLKASEKSQVYNDSVFRRLAVPFVRRLWRRQTRVSRTAEILSLILEYARAGRIKTEKSDFSKNGFFFHVIQMWERSPGKLEYALAGFLKTYEDDMRLNDLLHRLEFVPMKSRPRLLRLLILNLKSLAFDLNDDEKLGEPSTTWDSRLFMALPKHFSRTLFQRICVRGCIFNFPYDNSTEYGKTVMNFHERGETTLLELFLQQGDEDGVEKATEAVEARKKRATKSSEHSERAYWADYAIRCSIVSRSLDLYEETLLWARRFNRDGSTFNAIYRHDILCSPEGIALLCGIPKRSNIRTTDKETVKNNVTHGNRICMVLMETVCMSLLEPDRRQLSGVFDLFSDIVKQRLLLVNKFQDGLGLPDDEVYQAVLQPTLDLCLELERICLLQENEALGKSALGGLIQINAGTNFELRPRNHTFKFADEWARHRNHIWERLRLERDPTVNTLALPWTKGLPFQLLTPIISGPNNTDSMPYMISRAEAVVFADSKVALSEVSFKDTEMTNAIGPFVDNWGTCLKFWTDASPESDDRNARIKRAWMHAMNELTHSQVSTREKIDIWEGIFTDYKVDISFMKSEFDYPEPRLPAVEDMSEHAEWAPYHREKPISSDLPITCLDCMIYASTWSSTKIGNPLFEPDRYQQSRDLGFAPWISGKRTSPQTREALIAAAILLINERLCIGNRVLSKPFPSHSTVRFPALFLDQDFLEGKGGREVSTDEAVTMLDAFKADVPPILLGDLASAVLQTLEESQHFTRHAYRLIKMLAHGDRPQAAAQLIQVAILDRPQDSSWHRQLLTPGFLGSLSAQQVKRFFVEFLAAIEKRLLEQAKLPVAHTKLATKPDQPLSDIRVSAVKVTTIKMIAQLMSGTQYIPEDFAVEALAELFRSTRHRDVRISIVETLTTTLVDTVSGKVKNSILDFLESRIVPIVAALDGVRPMSEEDWTLAEDKDELPTIDENKNENSPLAPMLSAIFQVTSTLHRNERTDEAAVMVDRILLPILRLSTTNNMRWISMFLQKHNPVLLTARIPDMPADPRLLEQLVFDYSQYVPASILDMWRDFALFQLKFPTVVVDFNEAIQVSRLDITNSGTHWRSIYSTSLFSNTLRYRSSSPSLIDVWNTIPLTHKELGGITSAQLREITLEQANVLLYQYDFGSSGWDGFVRFLDPTMHRHNRPSTPHIRPIIQRLIEMVTALRTPAWQQDANRSPQILPDTFQMRMWLTIHPLIEDPDLERKTIVNGILAILHEITQDGKPYHDRFSQLQSSSRSYDTDDCVAIAIDLGSLADHKNPRLVDHLLIQLATHWLLTCDGQITYGTAKAAALTKQWIKSPDEDIRLLAMKLRNRFSAMK